MKFSLRIISVEIIYICGYLISNLKTFFKGQKYIQDKYMLFLIYQFF